MRNVAGKIADAIKNEWPLKILSVALAIALWGFVIARDNPSIEQQKTLLVEAVNIPAGLMTTSIQPNQVDVTLQGRRRAMAAADLDQVRVIADLNGRPTGEHTLPLETRGLPSTITAVPSARVARITLDRTDATERAVEVAVLGKQAEGFRLGTPRVEPARVTIEGASSSLRAVARVVAVVDVSGFNSTVQKQLAVELRDERNVRITGLRVVPATVEVVVPVTKVATKTVPIKPQLSAPPDGYQVASVQTSPNTVTIAGDESVIERIEYISTARISIGNLRGRDTFTLDLIFPEGAKPMGVGSATVVVTTERVSPESEPSSGDAETESPTPIEPSLSPDESDEAEAPADIAPPPDEPESSSD